MSKRKGRAYWRQRIHRRVNGFNSALSNPARLILLMAPRSMSVNYFQGVA